MQKTKSIAEENNMIYISLGIAIQDETRKTQQIITKTVFLPRIQEDGEKKTEHISSNEMTVNKCEKE